MAKLQKKVSKSEKYRSESYTITLTKSYIHVLSWKEGDEMIQRLTEDKKGIIIEKA